MKKMRIAPHLILDLEAITQKFAFLGRSGAVDEDVANFFHVCCGFWLDYAP